MSSRKRSSESGAEPDNNVRPKKAKVNTTAEAKTDSNGDRYWEISKMRRVTISSFRGKTQVNVREYYEKDGQELPGKKGISMPVDQFAAIISILPEIEQTLKENGEILPRPVYSAEGGQLTPKFPDISHTRLLCRRIVGNRTPSPSTTMIFLLEKLALVSNLTPSSSPGCTDDDPFPCLHLSGILRAEIDVSFLPPSVLLFHTAHPDVLTTLGVLTSLQSTWMVDSSFGKDRDLHGNTEFNVSHNAVPAAVLTIAS
ncbi:hypothetical protein ACN42_g8545 [Penicillium freii]|uniref:Transcriptional coactivator p15 (PC4) C-terminal domain-containing protein n=1 Tax=Penicillium freii TaxID=48697 RepID=A0A117NM27_PENFR|nr:hypothetical protein ACN42_g8545 [Penicillium freii]